MAPRRNSRDGGPLEETGHIVWLQSGTLYADSRGFAGSTSYDGEQVTFHHDVGYPGHDIGTLRSEGTRMIETGTNLDGSTFLEVWTPLPDSDGPAGSWTAAGTHTVRCGPPRRPRRRRRSRHPLHPPCRPSLTRPLHLGAAPSPGQNSTVTKPSSSAAAGSTTR
ncbi:hypothetical protein [Streptomyces lavendulae]|uniref:hypothetical protein n=1 Tax=Streptomyces lavendulae TaxID=1914 RepID=UPI0025564CEF|nr:hypothetical protein [Streptomyces lavendulae]